MIREVETVAYARHPIRALPPLVTDDREGEQKDTGQWQRNNASGRNMEIPSVTEDVTSTSLAFQVSLTQGHQCLALV